MFGGGAGDDALCAPLYAGDGGGWALIAGGVEGAGDDAPCAALYAGGHERAGRDALCVFSMPEAMEVGLRLLEAVDVP